jgi:hypothetical protein
MCRVAMHFALVGGLVFAACQAPPVPRAVTMTAYDPASIRPAARPPVRRSRATSRPAASAVSRPTLARDLPADRVGAGLARHPLPPWHRRVELSTDRVSLGRYFARSRYQPPEGALVIAARVRPGAGGELAFDYISLGNTGFRFSYPKRFFVASAIKLLASTAALWSLYRDRQLSSAATVEISDVDGSFHGTIHELLRETLIKSSNLGYDRLMELAGFDAVNDGFLVAERGLPRTVIQVRFGGRRPGISLRRSPLFYYREGERKGYVPERRGLAKHPHCALLHTCVCLYEMQEVMRRVMLDAELPRRERIVLAPGDIALLQRLLLRARNRLQPGVRDALGGPTAIYNNVGRVPGRDLIENSFIVHAGRGERYLMAALIPYDVKPDPKYVVKKRLSKLGKYVLRLLRHRRRARVLQHVDPKTGAAGEPFSLALTRPREGELALTLQTAAPIGQVVAYLNTRPLSCERAAPRRWRCDRRGLKTLRRPKAGRAAPQALLTVETRRAGKPVGYRLLALSSR